MLTIGDCRQQVAASLTDWRIKAFIRSSWQSEVRMCAALRATRQTTSMTQTRTFWCCCFRSIFLLEYTSNILVLLPPVCADSADVLQLHTDSAIYMSYTLAALPYARTKQCVNCWTLQFTLRPFYKCVCMFILSCVIFKLFYFLFHIKFNVVCDDGDS